MSDLESSHHLVSVRALLSLFLHFTAFGLHVILVQKIDGEAPFFLENVHFDGLNVISVKNCIRLGGET